MIIAPTMDFFMWYYVGRLFCEPRGLHFAAKNIIFVVA